MTAMRTSKSRFPTLPFTDRFAPHTGLIFGESEEDWDGVTILLVGSSHSSLIVTAMRLSNVEDMDQGSGSGSGSGLKYFVLLKI